MVPAVFLDLLSGFSKTKVGDFCEGLAFDNIDEDVFGFEVAVDLFPVVCVGHACCSFVEEFNAGAEFPVDVFAREIVFQVAAFTVLGDQDGCRRSLVALQGRNFFETVRSVRTKAKRYKVERTVLVWGNAFPKFHLCLEMFL